MAPGLNTRPDGDDEDPRPTKQPRLGKAEDSKEEKPKPEPDTDPMALDDQSPLVEAEDEPADTDPVAPNDQELVPTEQSLPGEAEDEPADFVEEPLRCSICMEEGHSYMSCPLTLFCPPETAVSDLAEIVCYCCCERIDSGVHAKIPDMTRAQLIPMWPRCMPDVDTKALELELRTKQPELGEAEDAKEEKPKPDTDPMALDDDQALQPTKQSRLVEAEDEPAVADFVEEPFRCSICMEEGHAYMSCPLTLFCPPETAVSDLAEIVCYCCCERIDSGVHAKIPDMTRAQLIPMWPRCMPDVDTKALELELRTKQPELGEAEDAKEEKPKPDTDPMALDDDQALQPTKQSRLVEAEDEPAVADFVEEPFRCSICMEEGHAYMSCPLTLFCPPETAVSDLAEIVCYCCCERIDSGVHAKIPDMTRAQLIPMWP